MTGRFQIRRYAAEYNEVTGTAAGAPLKGAVYEISEARDRPRLLAAQRHHL